MKTFVCAVSTFVFLFVLVTVNGTFFTRMTDAILADIDKASADDAGQEERKLALSEIRKTLNDNSFVISLSLGHDDVSALLAFVSDAERQINGDEGQFLSALDKLKTDVKRLKTSECFCFDGLF